MMSLLIPICRDAFPVSHPHCTEYHDLLTPKLPIPLYTLTPYMFILLYLFLTITHGEIDLLYRKTQPTASSTPLPRPYHLKYTQPFSVTRTSYLVSRRASQSYTPQKTISKHKHSGCLIYKKKTHRPPTPNTTSCSPRRRSNPCQTPSARRNPSSVSHPPTLGSRRGSPASRPGRRRRGRGRGRRRGRRRRAIPRRRRRGAA